MATTVTVMAAAIAAPCSRGHARHDGRQQPLKLCFFSSSDYGCKQPPFLISHVSPSHLISALHSGIMMSCRRQKAQGVTMQIKCQAGIRDRNQETHMYATPRSPTCSCRKSVSGYPASDKAQLRRVFEKAHTVRCLNDNLLPKLVARRPKKQE